MQRKISPFLICIFSFAICSAQQKPLPVYLHGTVKGFSNQVEVEDLSEFQYLLPPATGRVFIPDTTGHFSIKLTIPSPNYFRIGRNILYLSPGDDLTVFIDKADPRKSVFTGKGQEANTFLRFTPFPKGGSYIEAGTKAQRTAEETIDVLISAATLRTKQIDSLGESVSQEFKRLENARVIADLVNSLHAGNISFYQPRKMSKDSLATYTEAYTRLTTPLIAKYSQGFTDASLMKLVVYRDLADELVKQPGTKKDIQQINDWIRATDLTEQMKKISDKKELALFTKKIDSIATIPYRNAVATNLKGLIQFGKGDQAVDFTVSDNKGKQVKLSSLKGKVIYVDLWATWCGPCMAEMPHYDSLKAKYKNDPNIAFVSLSIDDDIPAWQSNMAKRNADGYQWLVNRTKLSAYNIVGIPRTLLISKDFTIADMNGPMPSAKNLPTILAELEK